MTPDERYPTVRVPAALTAAVAARTTRVPASARFRRCLRRAVLHVYRRHPARVAATVHLT